LSLPQAKSGAAVVASRHDKSVAAFPLPANLLDSVHSDRSPARNAWLAALPAVVAEFADRWSLRLGRPYQPGGRCAWVGPSRDRAGRDVVLKVAWRHDEALHEADGLRAWAGRGAVQLHDSAVTDATSVLLLEKPVALNWLTRGPWCVRATLPGWSSG
jgi:streptomycin 6-kinase